MGFDQLHSRTQGVIPLPCLDSRPAEDGRECVQKAEDREEERLSDNDIPDAAKGIMRFIIEISTEGSLGVHLDLPGLFLWLRF